MESKAAVNNLDNPTYAENAVLVGGVVLFIGACLLLAAAGYIAYRVHQMVDPLYFWVVLTGLALAGLGLHWLPARMKLVRVNLNRPRKD